MHCWKCHKDLEKAPIKFRTTCRLCDADLHVCKNCRFFAPGKPNDCAVPGTEYVRDREAFNFCEEFQLLEEWPTPPPLDRAKKLFGEEEVPKPKNFHSLFEDNLDDE